MPPVSRIVASLLLVASPAFAGAGRPGAVVEHVTAKPARPEALGTADYAPSAAEQPWFKKLGPGEVATGGLAGDYDLAKKNGVFVGWFGVVREVKEEKGQTTVLVEHKYFDGMTDTHILALSFNGSGDFTAVVPGVGHALEPLTLVKVYGVATVPKGHAPLVKADFVRNWHWGTFTFLMAAGTQRGSEQWRKKNTVELEAIYEPYPDDQYYEQRLGKR